MVSEGSVHAQLTPLLWEEYCDGRSVGHREVTHPMVARGKREQKSRGRE